MNAYRKTYNSKITFTANGVHDGSKHTYYAGQSFGAWLQGLLINVVIMAGAGGTIWFVITHLLH